MLCIVRQQEFHQFVKMRQSCAPLPGAGLALFKDRSTILTLLHAGTSIDNILEDVYIEARICAAFPGTFAQGIHLNNIRFTEKAPSVADQLAAEHYGFAIIVNLIIQYCKSGDINNLTHESSEYLDVLYDCLATIGNGTGIGQKNKVGRTYCQPGSYVEASKVFINLSDCDMFRLFSRTARYISAWEAAVCPNLVSRGHKAIQANIRQRQEG